MKVLPPPRRPQHGVVLIAGLLMLLVMTIIGVASMQTVVLEEKMAGNLRNRNVAFAAAEAGLQLGLTYLEGQREPPVVGGNPIWQGCLVSDDACVARGYEAWLETNGISYGSNPLGGAALTGVWSQPRIAIEERYVPPLDFEEAAEGRGIHFYTVTALGYGTSANARVLLQSTIGKMFSR